MSINSFTWVTEGGDLGTADWGCLSGHCASLCLCLPVAVQQAALVSDESALEACLRRCAIQTDDLYLYLYHKHYTIFCVVIITSLHKKVFSRKMQLHNT